MSPAYDQVLHAHDPAAELARQLLIATALAEKAAARAPERRDEVDALIAHLEEAVACAYRVAARRSTGTPRQLHVA